MDAAGDLVDTPQDFAGNKLIIAVTPGNPEGITGLADLAREDLKVVLAAPEVPAGKYADEALAKAGVTVGRSHSRCPSRASSPRSRWARRTPASSTSPTSQPPAESSTGIAIPGDQNVLATYPIAALTASAHPDDARAFVDLVLSAAGSAGPRRRGIPARAVTGDGARQGRQARREAWRPRRRRRRRHRAGAAARASALVRAGAGRVARRAPAATGALRSASCPSPRWRSSS